MHTHDKKEQAEDYAYTLQGWIKAVNGERSGVSNTINSGDPKTSQYTDPSGSERWKKPAWTIGKQLEDLREKESKGSLPQSV